MIEILDIILAQELNRTIDNFLSSRAGKMHRKNIANIKENN